MIRALCPSLAWPRGPVGGVPLLLTGCPFCSHVYMMARRALLGTPVPWAATLPSAQERPPWLSPSSPFPSTASQLLVSSRVVRSGGQPTGPESAPWVSVTCPGPVSSRGGVPVEIPAWRPHSTHHGPSFSGLSTSFALTPLGPVGDADLPSDLRQRGPHLVSRAVPEPSQPSEASDVLDHTFMGPSLVPFCKAGASQ